MRDDVPRLSDADLAAALVERGLLTADGAARALSSGLPLTDALIHLGLLTPAQLAQTLRAPTAGGPPAAGGARFRMDRRLGAGGMGEVWLAHDARLDRPVALKFMRHDDPDDAARFRREAQTAARLSHPNIAAVHEVGELDGRPFLAMQYVDGQSLSTHPRTDRRLMVQFVRDAARALDHAHRQGVIHRDVKPDNLMIDARGRLFVMDFGLARRVQDPALTQSGAILGTPHYMSPEQARGDPADARSDLFSLGATLYELVADRKPFGGGTVIEVLARVVNDDPDPPPVDRDLRTIVMTCLEKAPGRRYASAGALADELDRWLAGEPIVARPVGRVERWVRRVRRNPLAWSLGAAAGVAAIAAGIALVFLQGSYARERRLAWDLLRPIAEGILNLEDEKWRGGDAEALKRSAVPWRKQIDAMIERYPRFGPALAWRGRLKEILSDAGAEDDMNAACRVDPKSAEVWYVRGTFRAARYESLRGLPGLSWGDRGVEFDAPPPDTPEETLRRAGALEDFQRLAALAGADPLFSAEQARQGRAQVLLHQGRYDAALRELAGLDTQAARWSRALAAYQSKRFAEAIEALDELLKPWPAHAKAWMYRGRALHGLAVEAQVRGEDSEPGLRAAIADIQKSLSVDPGDAVAHGCLGCVRLDLGEVLAGRGVDPCAELEAAIGEFKYEADRYASFPSPFVNRGNAWRALALWKAGRGEDPRAAFRSAVEDYRRAFKNDPGAPGNSLGALFSDRGDWEAGRGGDPRRDYADSIEVLETTVAVDPKYALAWVNLGVTHAKRGKYLAQRGESPESDYRAAVEAFDRAVAMDAAYAGAHHNRGNAVSDLAEWKAGKGEDPTAGFEAAIRDHSRAVALNPAYGKAIQDRGIVLWNLGRWKAARGSDPTADYASAIADYRRAIEINPESAETHANLGTARMCVGDWRSAAGEPALEDYRAAIDDLRRAVAINPKFARARNALASACMTLGKALADAGEDPRDAFATALAEARRAIEDDPESADSYNTRGTVHHAVGVWKARRGEDPTADYRAAMESLEEAVRRNATLSEALSNLGTIGMALGHWMESRRQDPRDVYLRAVADFDRALAVNPARADVHHKKALTLDRAGLKAEALAAALEAQKLRPDDPLIRRTVDALRPARPPDDY